MRSPVSLFTSIFFVTLAHAEVFTWTDTQGNKHYSTKKVSGAQVAHLPTITKGEVKLTKSELKSCANHGGINCAAGADSDGSVLCFDGYRDAVARYRFSCSAPKLSITEIADPDERGSFTVFVRNAKSVKAEKVSATYKQPSGKSVPLNGPSTVDPFGVGEFVYNPKNKETAARIKPGLEDIDISCAGC